MSDEAVIAVEGAPPLRVRLRRNWARRLAYELLALIAALILLAAVALVLIDTAPGHRFLVDRIGQLETASGLKIRIGRIDGSIFGETRLKSVAVSDGQGVFLTSPEILLDWSPGAWLYNSLHIDRIEARRVTLSRLPRLKPSATKGPLLPGFDIHIGSLRIDRLELHKSVSGTERVGRVQGSVEIRAGRAMVDLRAALDGDGDRLALKLDAEPDRDRFDLDVRLTAPGDGLIAALAGTRRPIDLVIDGQGSWTIWRGNAALDLSGRPTARLALGVASGRYTLSGTLAPGQFLTGKLMRLTSPQVRVAGSGTLQDRQLDGVLTLSSPSLRTVAKGVIDFAGNRYRKVQLGVDLLRPPALFPNMTGKSVRMVWTLDGPFATATYAYRLTSPQVAFDNTGFVDVKAEGRGRLAAWPMRVPLRLTARRTIGVGDVAGGILANLRLEGMLNITPKLVRGDGLLLTSDKLKGKVSLMIDLVTGKFDILVSGGLTRYTIPGLGIVDVTSELHVVPSATGKGSRVIGTGKAWVRRLDNSFFRELTGGLPRLETRLERTPDGILHFSGLELFSPKLRLTGAGIRRRDGSFHIEARGRQAQYGPLKLTLDGQIERPRLDILLDRPNAAMGIAQMRLLMSPTQTGYDYRASGASRLGPFTSFGQILLPRNGLAVIAIAALDVSGTRASGALRADPGGFTGKLAVNGGGLAGELLFSPVNGNQKIEAHLTANGVRFAGPPGFSVTSGRMDGSILLAQGATSIDGVVIAKGLESGAIKLSRLTANAKLVNGSGEVRAAIAGQRGSAFEFVTLAKVTPDRITLGGKGQLDRKPFELASAAVLTREGDGWRVAPTDVRFGGGTMRLSGRTGARPELNAEVNAIPLQLLDMLWPKLDLGGFATGRIAYASANGVPSGRADLKLRGLSRAGLVLTSKPIDVGLAASLSGQQAAMRAVAVSDGKTIGRAQARFAPLGNGPVVAALMNARLFAQLRYAGPADTLWRLSGVEVFDLSGPVAIGADFNGSLLNPQIRGSLKTENARIESAVTGMVITGLASSGRFSGSRLVLDQMNGRTAGGGSISGSGSVDFSGGAPALDLAFTAAQARLLDRDDIAATVSGPLTVKSDGQGGRIGGTLTLDKGRFTLGRASAAASVPQLAVRHRGLNAEDDIEIEQLKPWRLDLAVAGNDLTVRGLGINSRWSTALKIGGSVDAPRLNGRADLVRGDYEFAGRDFRLERGIIRFQGESPVNPQLDISAQADVQGVDATVRVGGTGLKPEIVFASVPALPQDELLSRLLFGTSITSLSAPEAIQLASAVAALQSGSGGLDPINAVRRVVGLDRLRILPADVATGQKTAISAGKYLGRRLFVEVITDGQGYSATRVEYQVSRWLSLLSSISTIGRTSANVRVSKDY